MKAKRTLMWIEYFVGIQMMGCGLLFLVFVIFDNELCWETLWLALPIGLGLLLTFNAAKKEAILNDYDNKQAKLLNNYGKRI